MPRRYHRKLTIKQYLLPALAGVLLFFFILSISIFSYKSSNFHKAPPFSGWDYQSLNPASDITISTKATSKTGVIDFKYHDSSIEFQVPLTNSQLKQNSPNQISFNTSSLQVQYETLKNGLKENIILAKTPATNEFTSHLKVTNADTYLNSDNLPVFFDPKTKQYLFHVQKPYAFDAKGNRTYDVSYQLLKNKQPVSTLKPKNKIPLLDKLTKIEPSDSYSLVLKVDSKWLFDKSRVYPITIDPTIIHDQQSEFATGSLNRMKDVGTGDTAPSLETYYQELPADTNTVALWHMNESAGTTIADSSGNGYTGTLGTGTSAPALNSPSIINVGASFNGSTHYINTGVTRPSGDGTVELWFKMGVQTTYVSSTIRPIISQGDWNGTLSGIGIATFASNYASIGKIKFIWGIDSGSDQIITSATYNDDKWHHIAITKSGNVGTLYIDGQTIGTQSVGATTNVSTNFQLGGSTTGAERKFKGLIDEVRISSIARTPEQIKADAQRRPYGVYTSPVLDLGGSGDTASQYSLSWNEIGVATGDGETLADSTGLVAQWNFNELSGTTVYSTAGSCGTSCNGTLYNSGVGSTFSAIGGTITNSGGYTFHTFIGNGTFTPSGIASVEVLVVAGGGGAGAGGGGAGGLVYSQSFSVNSNPISVTVGNGGAGGSTGTAGGNSSFGSITAVGGGGGGAHATDNATSGGSGGGGGTDGSSYARRSGTAGQGNYGGISNRTSYGGAGGGGGAGSAGGDATTETSVIGDGGNGGSGLQFQQFSPVGGSPAGWFAGGGGGGANTNTTNATAGGLGGSGGGGNGARANGGSGSSAVANTGGGGGGRDPEGAAGGSGGSGIVIIRYPTSTALSGLNSTEQRWGAGAVTLDGLDDYIDIPDHSTLHVGGGPFTIETWVKPNELATRHTVFSTRKTNAAGSWQLEVGSGSGGIGRVSMVGVGTWIFDSVDNAVKAGVWNHIVYTRSSNSDTGKMYVNGQAVSAGATTAYTITDNTDNKMIGTGTTLTTFFPGIIDTTRLYSRVLSPTEVLSNYNAANIELQTRVGNSSDPNDGTWEDWKPSLGTTETSLNSFDTLPIVQPYEISNLALWLKADTINLGFDAAIDNWLDSSGNNHTFSQAVSSQRPIYRHNILNGKPVVHFASSLSQTLTNPTSFGAPSTVIYVSRQTGGANYRLLSGLNNNWLLGYWGGAKRQAFFDGWVSPSSTPTSDTNWHIYESTHNGLISEAYEDGNLYASNSKGIAGPNGLSLNGAYGTGQFSNGEIAEVIVYSKTLSTDERRAIEKYLADKYNLPIATAYSETNDTSIKVESTAAKRIATNQIQSDFNTVGLWHLDETSGTGAYLKDSSTSLNHGTPTGTTIVNGISGKARSFNGTSDVISLGNPTSLRITGPITTEAWIKTSAAAAYRGFISKMGVGSSYYAYTLRQTSAGYAQFGVSSNGSVFTYTSGNTAINDGRWHHVAGVFVPSTSISVYVDGVLQSVNSASIPASIYNTSGNAIIGCTYTTPSECMSGVIDEPRISNVALTAEEIAEDYRLGANHYLNSTIVSTDLSDKSSLSFYVAADRPGQYLNLSVGNNAFSNYQADSNTVALWHLDENISENFRSCYAWRQAGYTTDGIYTIDPDGPNGNAPFLAYCNMTYDGGGWTMIVKSWYGSNLIGNANAVGAVTDATTQKGNPYKLSDQSIRDIIGPSNNFDVMADQNGYNSAYSTGNYEFVVIRNYTGVWTYEKAMPTSTTTTVFQSYRISDKALAWTGNLYCGYDAGSGTAGINCVGNVAGTTNPQGGSGCTINMGSQSNAGWYHFFMNQYNDDTYLYICNGAQHSSGFAMNHRFWVRERAPVTSTIKNSASLSTGTTLSLVSAVGGTITNVNGYTIHTFLGNGTFQVLNGGNGNVEALVVGGGGGGANTGGGGGGGGFVYQTVPVGVQSYNITVGSGGAGGSSSGAAGSNGGNSVFSTITALGGGGGSAHGGSSGANGGCGGGGAIKPAAPVSIGGTGYQGYNGGDSTVQASWIGNNGGGGGAGAAGAIGSTAAGSGGGGNGHRSSITGTSVYYAGGGGGSNVNGSQAVGVGGSGGGGSAILNGAGSLGAPNTGGGGGGGSYNAGTYLNGGSGGSGIVIIRYPNINSTIITPRDGSANGTTTTQGVLGKARNFNGINDYIDLGNPTSLQITGDQTIDMWLKPTSYDGVTRRNPFNKSYGGEGTITLEPTGLLSYYYGTNGNDGSPYQGFNSKMTIPAGQWSHIAIVRDLTNMQLKWYINGVLVSQNTATYSSAAPSTQNVYIGKGYAGPPFLGSIDEVRVSNVARSGSDIRSTYESGLRTHPITIDFSASLSATNLITGSGDLSFTIDATTRGLSQKGAMLFNGDKIIVKENIDGTEYIAQGTVNSISSSTGNATVSSWDATSTFPPSGFTAQADVFKWQREFFKISQKVPSSQVNGITNISLRLSDGSEGRNIWLDDLKSSTGYLTNNLGSTLSSTAGSRYLQYRLIETTSDANVSPSVNQVSLNYTSSSVPGAPNNLTPGVGTTTSYFPSFSLNATDSNSDYLRYKILLCTNSNMVSGCQTFDQTNSQLNWNGQNTQAGSAYTSGATAYYSPLTALKPGTTYYWKSWAIDPGGSNLWGATQSTISSFTTINQQPTVNTCTVYEASDKTYLRPQWQINATGFSNIEVQRKRDDDAAFTNLVTLGPGITGYYDYGVPLNHTYQYQIAPIYPDSTYGSWCQTSTLNLNSPPTDPTPMPTNVTYPDRPALIL